MASDKEQIEAHEEILNSKSAKVDVPFFSRSSISLCTIARGEIRDQN